MAREMDTGTGRPTARPGSPRSRRRMLAGAAAGALGVLAAESLATAAPAQAGDGDPVLQGKDNKFTAAHTAVMTVKGNEIGALADPGAATFGSVGVYGAGRAVGVAGDATVHGGLAVGVEGIGANGATGILADHDGTGVAGLGGQFGGTGVRGDGGAPGAPEIFGGTGVQGIGADADPTFGGTGVLGTGGAGGGTGVHGVAGPGGGTGVVAESTTGGTALRVLGTAQFSRSGVIMIAPGHSSATKTAVALTPASLILATIQDQHAGLFLQATVPDVAGKSFTVHLSKTAPATVRVAWFIVN